MGSKIKTVTKSLCTIVAIFVAINIGLTAKSPAQTSVTTQVGTSRYAGEFEVAIHKSQILKVDQAFADLLVGNPKIADVVPLTNRTVYVLGKAHGTTSLSIYGPGKTLLAILDVVVTHDVDGLKKRLFELMPDEKIEVRSVNNSVVLAGTLSTASRVQQAVALADQYAPGKVTNMLATKGSQQVMLAVRFAEMKRQAIKDLGINSQVFARIGGSTFSLLTGFPTSGAIAGGTSILGTFIDGSTRVDALLDALEKKGVVRTLAEPNLIALSGETASFLAGGEFPIPVAQNVSAGSATITVEFKEFGVSLAFTPTVLTNTLISLEVAPEVSAIDAASSVSVNGLSVPGLTTRRAKTRIELNDGQSFAIAGLLQSEFKSQVDQLPFAGDVPVLGALFRSADYQADESELVIIVTPYLVKPVKPNELVLPTDTFVPPSELELFLLGKPESRAAGTDGETKQGHVVLGDGVDPRLDGAYGHIVK
jgi:pilus assembly protein CpaC